MTQDDLAPFLTLAVNIEQTYLGRKHGPSEQEADGEAHLGDLFHLMWMARNLYDEIAEKHGLQSYKDVLKDTSRTTDLPF